MPLQSIRLILSAVLVVLCGCSAGPDNHPGLLHTGFTMGTSYTVKVTGELQKQQRQQLVSSIEGLLMEINRQMSTYIEDSELSRINLHRSGDWLAISTPVYEVLNAARVVSELSHGAFDVTVGPIVNLWGFGPDARPEKIPSDTEIESAQLQVGYHHISLRADPAALKKGVAALEIDLSGIAKGYAVERIARLLEKRGFTDYMVEIGGEIHARGVNQRGDKWRIGIEMPLSEQRALQRVISLDGMGMATSGDYRNYFEQDGVRYSHTINPFTGRPITHTLASVTVLNRSTTLADALATALLVLGPEQGYALAEQENLAALFIIRGSSGFEERSTSAFLPHLTVD